MGSSAALRDGLGVAQDYTKAREWYKKAADKGTRTPCRASPTFTLTVTAWRRTTPRRCSCRKRMRRKWSQRR